MKLTPARVTVAALVLAGAVCLLAGTRPLNGADPLPPGVSLQIENAEALHEQVVNAMESAPAELTGAPGLVGAKGGVRLKLLAEGPSDVILPLPQLVGAQVPIAFAITATPPEAAAAFRLHKRDDANVVVGVTLRGAPGQEVQLAWAAVVLVAEPSDAPAGDAHEAYRAATACVQSGDERIATLAEDLWPENADPAAYAANIQQFVRKLKQERPPQSIDALDMLDSKVNGICTASANLAAALLRAKNIPARTLAVIPPTGRRLEMHRIVEYYDDGQWRRFDPSLVHADVPMSPWQSVVMATTTIADEDVAMQPRRAVVPGAPYGQEIEILSPGVTLTGADFFWTEARPLAEFDVTAEALDHAQTQWQAFLIAGKLSESQIQSAAATTPEDFAKALKTP
jgi:hypothetical protein